MQLITLKDLLCVIDQYQHIIIQHGGDQLFNGQRMYFGDVTESHSEFKVLNILCVLCEEPFGPIITICIDKGFC